MPLRRSTTLINRVMQCIFRGISSCFENLPKLHYDIYYSLAHLKISEMLKQKSIPYPISDFLSREFLTFIIRMCSKSQTSQISDCFCQLWLVCIYCSCFCLSKFQTHSGILGFNQLNMSNQNSTEGT